MSALSTCYVYYCSICISSYASQASPVLLKQRTDLSYSLPCNEAYDLVSFPVNDSSFASKFTLQAL